jgi:hypothetical protein
MRVDKGVKDVEVAAAHLRWPRCILIARHRLIRFADMPHPK